MIVADITKAYPGTESPLFRRASAYMRKTGDTEITVVCCDAQVQLAVSEYPQSPPIVIEGDTGYAAAELIWSKYVEPSVSTGVQVTVFTFHPPVIALSQRLPSTAQQRFTFAYWMTLSETGHVERPLPKAQRDFPLTESEMLAAFENALAKHPTGVRMTDLRYVLAVENLAFDKIATPLSAAPGFISRLVTKAKNAGLVEVDASRVAQNPIVRLKKESMKSVSPAPSVPAAALARAATRAQHFADLLRKSDLGPFSTVRAALFDNLEMLGSQKQYTSNSLIRAGVDVTKRSSNVNEQYPWWAVEKFLFRLLGLQRVLVGIGNEQLDPNSLESLGIIVGALKEGWRNILDAELICFLIRHDSNVAAFDIPDLAGVLYGDRSAETQVGVEKLLKLLEADGKIGYEKGVFVIKLVEA